MNENVEAGPSLEEQMTLKNSWGQTKEREFAEAERKYQELRKQREAFRDEREDRLYKLVARCSGGALNMDAADVDRKSVV